MDVKSNVIGIGHNAPPPTPYELSKQAITDLHGEVTLWCDGAEIATPEQAEGVQNLIRMVQAAAKEADERRKAEAKVFDEGKAEVQARYNPLRDMADSAIKALKANLTPWLLRLAAEQEAKAAAARAEAEAAARVAMEAHRIADASNLAEATAAEALIDAAQEAQKAANRAEKATATISGGFGGASGLRTSYRAEVTDYTEFARHAWKTRKMDLHEFLDDLAQQMVSKGLRDLPGVTVTEVKTVV